MNHSVTKYFKLKVRNDFVIFVMFFLQILAAFILFRIIKAKEVEKKIMNIKRNVITRSDVRRYNTISFIVCTLKFLIILFEFDV